MSDWLPTEYEEDPVANAIMNLAAEMNAVATAVNGLLYGLKYSKAEGMSIAEAIEEAGKAIQSGVEYVGDQLLKDDE